MNYVKGIKGFDKDELENKLSLAKQDETIGAWDQGDLRNRFGNACLEFRLGTYQRNKWYDKNKKKIQKVLDEFLFVNFLSYVKSELRKNPDKDFTGYNQITSAVANVSLKISSHEYDANSMGTWDDFATWIREELSPYGIEVHYKEYKFQRFLWSYSLVMDFYIFTKENKIKEYVLNKK